MPTLENRRLYLKLCSLYKIIYGHFYFPPNVFIAQPSRTPLVSPLLNQPHARTNYYQSSFVPSTISVWNNLPHTALRAHTIYSIIQSTHRTFLTLGAHSRSEGYCSCPVCLCVCVCVSVRSFLPPRASRPRNIGTYVLTATRKNFYNRDFR